MVVSPRKFLLTLPCLLFISFAACGPRDPSAATTTVVAAAAGAVSGVIRSDSGTTMGADDVPLAGAIASVSSGGTPTASAVTAADGRFVLNGLAPGSYQLDVRAEGFVSPPPATVVVHEGVTTTSDRTLAKRR